jgi:ribosomal-protein-alanine N-acetyltransferase
VPEISIRTATAADEPFLRDMLFEAIFVPEGTAPLPRAVIDSPGLAHYVAGYGRAGDHGLVALDGSTPVGAAWVRALTASDPGYGYVDDVTPELTVAVAPGRRGCGIGSRLLRELLAALEGVVPAVSLSCDPANPAMRLYERLGFVAVGESGGSITMCMHT